MSEEVAKALAAASEVPAINEDTIFGKILRKEIPCNFIYEDDKVIIKKYYNNSEPNHNLNSFAVCGFPRSQPSSSGSLFGNSTKSYRTAIKGR